MCAPAHDYMETGEGSESVSRRRMFCVYERDWETTCDEHCSFCIEVRVTDISAEYHEV